MKRRGTRKLPIYLTLGACALAVAAGGLLARGSAQQVFADEAQEIGRLLLEQTDALGNKVTVPVEYDGEKYMLKDLLRNIFVCDASGARSEQEVMRTNFPVYTSYTGVFDDGMAISVYQNAIKAYDFYTSAMVGEDFLGLNGRNDDVAGNLSERREEMPFYLNVHFNAGGMRFNAAYTPLDNVNAGVMIVGDGDNTNSYNVRQYDLYHQGVATDVISHEYQHGITQHVANLNIGGDPGAINEAISDIFGALIEGHDPSEEEFWSMGESCTVKAAAMRSVKSPRTVGHSLGAETMSDKMVCKHNRHTNACDNGYVHYNSTIISHLQYTAYEQYPEFFTRERIARLWFETLKRIPSNVTFQTFASEFRAAAAALQFEEKAMDAIDYSLYINGILDTGKFHKVSFMNDDGTLLESEIVKNGESAVAPETTPEKPADKTYRYIFEGWDNLLDNVTRDLVLRPVFRAELRYYNVEFLDDSGNVFRLEENVSYSDLESVQNTEGLTPPEKPSTAQYYYEFERWEVDVNETDGRVVITPIYRQRTQVYTVSYQYRGEEYYSVTRPYGTLELVDPPEGCLGWYMDEDCTIAAGGRMVDHNMVLYGKPEHDFAPLIITLFCVGAAVLIGGGVAAFVIIRKKRR